MVGPPSRLGSRLVENALDSHFANHRLNLLGGNHLNGIPGAAIEKGAIWTFARTLLTTNAEKGIDFDMAKGGVIFVGNPEHVP